MRTFTLLLLAMLTALGASAATEEFDYELTVGSFNRLKVVNNINVVYVQSADSAGIARFRAPKVMSDYFLATNKDGQLKLETMPYETPVKPFPTLYVYSEFLEEVENDGDSTVNVIDISPCSTFKTTVVGNGRITVDSIRSINVEASIKTGNGTIVLNGQCNNAKFNMVGTGLIQADNLRSDYVGCRILGSGSIGCWPRFELKVRGIGSTKIYYRGKPDINKKGGGKLLPLESYDDNNDYIEERQQ